MCVQVCVWDEGCADGAAQKTEAISGSPHSMLLILYSFHLFGFSILPTHQSQVATGTKKKRERNDAALMCHDMEIQWLKYHSCDS